MQKRWTDRGMKGMMKEMYDVKGVKKARNEAEKRVRSRKFGKQEGNEAG